MKDPKKKLLRKAARDARIQPITRYGAAAHLKAYRAIKPHVPELKHPHTAPNGQKLHQALKQSRTALSAQRQQKQREREGGNPRLAAQLHREAHEQLHALSKHYHSLGKHKLGKALHHLAKYHQTRPSNFPRHSEEIAPEFQMNIELQELISESKALVEWSPEQAKHRAYLRKTGKESFTGSWKGGYESELRLSRAARQASREAKKITKGHPSFVKAHTKAAKLHKAAFHAIARRKHTGVTAKLTAHHRKWHHYHIKQIQTP